MKPTQIDVKRNFIKRPTAQPAAASQGINDHIDWDKIVTHVGAVLQFLSGRLNSLPNEVAKAPGAKALLKAYSESSATREQFLRDVVDKCGSVAAFVEAAESDLRDLVTHFASPKSSQSSSVVTLFRDKVLSILSEQDDRDLCATVVAALTTAIRTEKQDQVRSSGSILFGYRLGRFLIEIGAAKVAQILNSYDETNPDWEAGLAVSKDQVNPLSKEEFIKAAYPMLPEHLKKAWDNGEIVVGESIGTGTYLDTRKITLAESYKSQKREYQSLEKDTSFVMQVVKPAAAERADRVYTLLLAILESLPEGERVANVDTAALRVLISDYKESLAEEVDLLGAMSKNKLAHRMASEIQLELVDNFSLRNGLFGSDFKARVNFSSARAIEAWAGGRIATEMHGVHFKDLPDRTAADKQVKLFCAISIFMANLYHLNSGRAYDKDRHSAQQKIQVDVDRKGKIAHIAINNLDELGICPPPTQAQKEIFADMLMDAIGCAMTREIDFDETIKEAFCSLCKKQSKRTTHVGTMLKTLVTSSDVQKYIERYTKNLLVNGWIYEEMISALAAAEPDTVIAGRIKERFESISLLLAPRKAVTEREKNLLELERARASSEYPIEKSRAQNVSAKIKVLKGLKITFQPSAFKGLGKRIAAGKPSLYKIIKP